MGWRSRWLTGLLILLALLLCAAAAAQEQEAALDAMLDGNRIFLPFDGMAELVPLTADQQLRIEEIGRDAHSSHHVVAIRDAEIPHRHDRHDLLVVMIAGRGSILMGTERRPVVAGSVLYIPRGTLHAFRNETEQPAIAYAVYTPAFDGRDRIEAARDPARDPNRDPTRDPDRGPEGRDQAGQDPGGAKPAPQESPLH